MRSAAGLVLLVTWILALDTNGWAALIRATAGVLVLIWFHLGPTARPTHPDPDRIRHHFAGIAPLVAMAGDAPTGWAFVPGLLLIGSDSG